MQGIIIYLMLTTQAQSYYYKSLYPNVLWLYIVYLLISVIATWLRDWPYGYLF